MLLPFSSQLAEYNYTELEFPWAVLYQAINRDSKQILERRFSFLEFFNFISEEIINEPLYDNNGNKLCDFHYFNKRPVENLNYLSRYTWTLDNSVDAEGNFLDNEWLFNKFIGWEKTAIKYTHWGRYLPITVGNLKWGSLTDIVVNSKHSIRDPLELLELKFNIQNSPENINNDNYLDYLPENVISPTVTGSRITYIIPLSDSVYCVEIKSILGEIDYYWTDSLGEESIPFNNSKEFTKTKYLKIITPNPKTLTPSKPVDYRSKIGSTYTIRSKVEGIEKQTYKSPGYLELIFYGYKIHQTINLTNPKIEDPIYEIFEDIQDINTYVQDPWPNYKRIDLTIKEYYS